MKFVLGYYRSTTKRDRYKPVPFCVEELGFRTTGSREPRRGDAIEA